MNDVRRILVETATKVFRDLCPPETVNTAEQGVWPAELWGTLEQTGLTLVSIPEAAGGSGGSLGDALAVLRLAGRFAAPIPLAETYLAGWILAKSGQPVPAGPLTVAPVRHDEQLAFRRGPESWLLAGSARRVPWARQAGRIVVAGRSGDDLVVAALEPGAAGLTPGQNLAGEPRDDVVFDGVSVSEAAIVPASTQIDEEALWQRGALTRVALMAGALERILELAVTYAGDRIQFGRPIGRFQAIQQQLAILAGEVAAAGAATEAAIVAAEAGEAAAEIAAAKTRVGEAVGTAAAIAHQVHGATGFTYEHTLHHSTRRLWAWRDEFGSETEWATRLGRRIADGGPDSLWPFITAG